MSRRDPFIAWLTSVEGAPYLWGGKGEFHEVPGLGEVPAFDCSGLVTCGLHAVGGPDWRTTHNSARLWHALPPAVKPQAGDLYFYGPKDSPVHVMALMPGGRVYGACGGNSSTSTIAVALRIKARVMYRSKPDYRPDMLGARSLGQFLDARG